MYYVYSNNSKWIENQIYNNTMFTIYNTEHEFNVRISNLHPKMKSQEARVHCLEWGTIFTFLENERFKTIFKKIVLGFSLNRQFDRRNRRLTRVSL